MNSNLAFLDCVVGANCCTATAADASVGIDNIDIAGRDSLNGANGLACTTCDATVCNYVSHN